ncbi:hypothetical protein LSG31_15640 [Fodinisporobacter ferrooxydans]|uniref:Uncharacterized protein n=1 Tax=Fodinisporobacter ferrooxydans TaxID=2901836 RepID=A0ABY4CGB0_9BACL|nr:hypothetical protein LSG31_15640 [Alicyclobacillaceae bacterium MYW30-H2]
MFKLFNKDKKPTSNITEEIPAQITSTGGLGDRYHTFEKSYGENSGVTEWGRFQDNSIFVRFFEDRAIMVQFIQNDQPLSDKQAALQKALEILPKDAKILEEKTELEGTDGKAEYFLLESQLLQAVFESKSLESVKDPQYCTLCLTANETGYFLITATLGDYLYHEDRTNLILKHDLF